MYMLYMNIQKTKYQKHIYYLHIYNTRTDGDYEPALTGDTPILAWIIWSLAPGDQYASMSYKVPYAYLVVFTKGSSLNQ